MNNQLLFYNTVIRFAAPKPETGQVVRHFQRASASYKKYSLRPSILATVGHRYYPSQEISFLSLLSVKRDTTKANYSIIDET